MAFKFSIGQQNVLNQERKFLLDEVAELCDARSSLEEHFGRLDAIENVMENISTSLKALDTIENSDDVLKVLNTDQAIENLLGVAETAINKKIVTEGLGEALKKAWETFKNWCREFWEKVKAFFRRIRDWLFGKKQVEEGVQKTVTMVDTSNARLKTDLLNKISRVKKNLTDAKKDLPADASNEAKQALDAWRGAVEEYVKAELDFIKLIDEDPLWLKQATKDQNAKVQKAIGHMYLMKMRFLEAKNKKTQAAAAAAPASPPTPPNDSPSSGGAAMPLPPEEDPKVPEPSQKFMGPRASAVKEAVAAMKQLANALPPAFSAQSRGIKEVYKLFEDDDEKYKDASNAAKAMIESLRIVAGVFNAAFKKRKGIELEVGDLGAITWLKSVSDDDEYVTITSLEELGWKDEDEVVKVCKEFSDARSSVIKAVGDIADKFYLDYPDKADDEDASEKIKSLMRLYRLASSIERLGGMICTFASSYINGGVRDTLDFVVYLKKRRGVILRRENAAAARFAN